MSKGTDVAVKVDNSVPAFLQGTDGYTGAEGIDKTDITIPQIKLGQAMSSEVKEGSVNEGDLFLNVTGEVLAEAGAPLRFIPIAGTKEYLLWRDRNHEGGGIMARAKKSKQLTADGDPLYIWDKPGETFKNKVKGVVDVEWTTEADGLVPETGLDAWGSEIPGEDDSGKAATAHHNYVVCLPDNGNLIAAFSLSRTQVKAANDFNAMLNMATLPIYARLFTVTTFEQTKGGDKWANLKMKPAGVSQDEPLYLKLKALHEQYVGGKFNVDQTGEAGGDPKDDGGF
jgi:hypothetical protein